MTLRPTPVIMVSNLTARGTEATIKALEIGAFDCIGQTCAGRPRNCFPICAAKGESRRRCTATPREVGTPQRGAGAGTAGGA